jgi:hypothetical protein
MKLETIRRESLQNTKEYQKKLSIDYGLGNMGL